MRDDDDKIKAKLLERTTQMLDATVDEMMTRQVITCDWGELASKAVRLILEHGVLGILVFKEARPHSTVTVFELLALAYEEVFDPNRDFLRMTVGELVKDKELVSVPSGTRLREALNLMIDRNIRTIPIIDNGLVQGIVSVTDLVRWYRDTHDEVRTGHLQHLSDR